MASTQQNSIGWLKINEETPISALYTHSVVISSGLGAVTVWGPVTVSIVLPGVCLPLGGPPFGPAPFLLPDGADFYKAKSQLLRSQTIGC